MILALLQQECRGKCMNVARLQVCNLDNKSAVYSVMCQSELRACAAASQVISRPCTQAASQSKRVHTAISYESPRACTHLLLKKDQVHANSCLSSQTNSMHIRIARTCASQSLYSWSMSIKNKGRGGTGRTPGPVLPLFRKDSPSELPASPMVMCTAPHGSTL